METGFFTVEILKEIDKAQSLNDAKQIAVDAVNDQPNAKEYNKKKALGVIGKARNKQQLMINLGNFLLAHPSEGLSMQKGSK